MSENPYDKLIDSKNQELRELSRKNEQLKDVENLLHDARNDLTKQTVEHENTLMRIKVIRQLISRGTTKEEILGKIDEIINI